MKGLRSSWWALAVGACVVVLTVGGCELFQPKVAVDFEISASFGVLPLPVAFTPVVEEEVVSFYWDFGDGATSSEDYPVHVYRTEGTFTVSLTVTMSDGTFGTTSKKSCVRVEEISQKERLTPLYWLDKTAGTIYWGDRAGLGSEAIVQYVYRGEGLAAGRGFLYWTADTTLHRANADGTGSTAIATNQLGLYSVSIDNVFGRVYWTCRRSVPSLTGAEWVGAIKRANLDGSGAAVVKSYLPVDGQFAWWIGCDGNGERYYWVLGDYDVFSPRDVRPKEVCDWSFQWSYVSSFSPRAVKASLCPMYSGVTLDMSGYPANYIYWTTGSEIKRCRVDGTANTTILTGLSSARGIAVDLEEGKMYWSDSAGIHRASLDGSAAELIYPDARADVLVLAW